MIDVKIPVSTPSKEFMEHLSLKNNNRIIFSGPFGIGKTTFIQTFFSENDFYVPIYLRPVNYTLTSNEDIFKLIKYDILHQLMQTEYVKVDGFEKFSKAEIATNFLSTLALEDIAPLIEGFGKIGASISKIALSLEKLSKKYHAFKEEINTNQDLKKIDHFLQNVKEGHFLLEQDFIADVINDTIESINKEKDPGGAVLIIDDLDRIDPEHIFRLFNVFSTHFDYSDESKNKFSFNKIIFVCDIINIKSIFKSKYGLNTDFNGYIDKFYSIKIFSYNNRKAITEFVTRYVPYNGLIAGLDPVELRFLVDILSEMMNYGLINLRNLKKITLKDEDETVNIIDTNSLKLLRIGRLPFSYIFLILTYLIGELSALITILNTCVERTSKGKTIDLTPEKEILYFKRYFLPLLDYNPDGFIEDIALIYRGDKIPINYVLKSNINNNMVTAELQNPYSFPPGTVWTWMLEAVEVLKKEMN